MDHNKRWKTLEEMGIPDHLTCLLKNLYTGQEATVRTGHETMDWFKLGKEYVKAVYCLPAYLTSMQSTSWEIPDWIKQVRIKTVGRNINNLTIAETEEELKFSLMRVRVESE